MPALLRHERRKKKYNSTYISQYSTIRLLAPWRLIPAKNAEAVYRAAAIRYGERITISWPPDWRIEFHPDPYRTYRVQRQMPNPHLLTGWPAIHRAPRRARDCGR